MSSFFEIGLSNHLTRAITDMGFEETTPIQEKTIPLALEGKDIIGQAQTGTGKTAAFGIPMIERMNPERDYIKGLVITPTRELAIQVAEELNRIGQFKESVFAIYCGQDIDRKSGP
jgi:ATP-dependent RNA helicase DeaD